MLNVQMNKEMDVRMYDIHGRLIFEELAKDGNLGIEMEAFNCGIYFLHLSANGVRLIHERIVVE